MSGTAVAVVEPSPISGFDSLLNSACGGATASVGPRKLSVPSDGADTTNGEHNRAFQEPNPIPDVETQCKRGFRRGPAPIGMREVCVPRHRTVTAKHVPEQSVDCPAVMALGVFDNALERW